MVDQKMCRICMAKENLTSIFSIMDGGKISDKINFVCGIKILSSDEDRFPKLICHQCLSSMIIASSIKRKSLETEKIFLEMVPEEDEFIEQAYSDEDEALLVESKVDLKSKYLVYEENSRIQNQPKMNYSLTRSSSAKISSTNFNYNPELKSFVESYLHNKPNLEIIKITDANCIEDIERVLEINADMTGSSLVKRQRTERNRIIPRLRQSIISEPSSSRLLNALAGHRLSNITVNRINSPSINTTNRKNIHRE